MKSGTLCISLDFEKFWGIHDVANLEEVHSKLSQVSGVVDGLLELFTKYNIHCTWATVGLLNVADFNALKQFAIIPYKNENYSPFPIEKHQLTEADFSIIFAKKEIDRIKNTQYQELACHTFSHFYCLESGVGASDFEKDMQLYKNLVKSDVKSIVFPRNQIDVDCLEVCKKNGIIAYRGNQVNKFWVNSTYRNERIINKIGRSLDAFVKISKNSLIDWSNLENKQNGLINISASRFLKPYQFNKVIENLKVRRIKKEMLESAKTNKIYHLWWHPHNYTTYTEENFKQLEELLKYFKILQKQYNYQSLNMNEIAQYVG